MKKLKNKETGEIGELQITEKHYAVVVGNGTANCYVKMYCSLTKLNEEWEDYYEEPKEYWHIGYDGKVFPIGDHGGVEAMKQIGNYFETREEAEKAVEKLKAWKRLKDDGLKIRKYELNGGTDRNGCFTGDICLTLDISKPVYEDILQLLFGGEE